MATEKRNFQQEIKNARDNYNALASKFKSSAHPDEIYRALNNLSYIDPNDKDLVSKAYGIVKDRKNNKILRISALNKLTRYLHDSESSVKDMISLIANTDEPVEMRRSAMQALAAISFTSPALAALLPEYKQALRHLLESNDTQLLTRAIETLVGYKDELVQKKLLEGLKDHTMALVPDAKAIQLLGMDIRSEYYPVIRKILKHSANPDIQIEAVIALSGDPDSQDLIKKLLEDKNTVKNVRMTCISALNSHNPDDFQLIAKDMIGDVEEHRDIKAALLTTLSLHQKLSKGLVSDSFTKKVKVLSLENHKALKKASSYFLAKKR